MRASATILLVAAMALRVSGADAPAPEPVAPMDPDIQEIVRAISAERIQRSIFVLASFKTRHTLSDPLPSGDGIGGAAAWVRAEFERASKDGGGRLRVELDTFDQPMAPPRIPQPMQITNIVATLPGTDESSGRTLVMSSHYDSRATNPLDASSAAPGADDDGSGVAAVLELARVMSHYRFRATIVFLAVAGEEQALNGSTHWAKAARERDANIEAMMSDDIIGSSRSQAGVVDRSTIRLFAQGVPPVAKPDDEQLALLRAGGENDTPPRELARAIRETAGLYVPTMKVRIIYRMDRYLRGSDHLSFLQYGFPAVRFTEPAEDFRRQHQDVRMENGVQYGDTPDHVDFAYTADVARVNGAALAVIARAPAEPTGVQLDASRLENDTRLRWLPGTDDAVAEYRIVWRETTSPYWEHSLMVGKDATRVTIPESRDNVIFGVEAVDAAGHASPAVYPAARTTL